MRALKPNQATDGRTLTGHGERERADEHSAHDDIIPERVAHDTVHRDLACVVAQVRMRMSGILANSTMHAMKAK